MTEQYEELTEMADPRTPVIIHKHVRRFEVSIPYAFLWTISLVAVLVLCQMTYTFGAIALVSAENVLGVRGDGIPPALSVPPPPTIGITPLPTEQGSLELVPTITRIGETAPITGTEVITP